ncbi:MAG: hypothetical protein IID14_09110, partial [Candidatus Marinimicrobia bacterium]|nr:hypothetical protein [Candidatus Neomarinimicrobiota bacterium]
MDRLSKGDIMESVSRVFLARQLRDRGAPLDFIDFLTATIRTDGGLYSFDRHGPLLEIARRLPNLTEAWILKGAQVG